MTREQYIDEFLDHISTYVYSTPTRSNILDAEKVAETIEYRLEWLFDNYSFIKRDTPLSELRLKDDSIKVKVR